MTDDVSPLGLARAIAAAFADGVWRPARMADRARRALGADVGDWLDELALDTYSFFGSSPPMPSEVVAFVLPFVVELDEPPDDEIEREEPDERFVMPVRQPRVHRVPKQADGWRVLDLPSVRALAVELGLHPVSLQWCADVRSYERTARDEGLRHYRYRWLAKRTGGARLLEAPKPILRFFQRRLLRDVIEPIPVHAAAHGFVRGRSVHTFVAPHVGRAVVVRIDLESFFASVSAGRVFGIFATAGYHREVAHALTGLVTNAAPVSVLDACPRGPAELLDAQRRTRRRLAAPHLPQGAPTSPALANLAAYRLDRRLSGLAASFGASFTRYADDLAFSGGRRLARSAPALIELVSEIARSEGFRVNPRKTRVRTSSERQVLGGLVVNDRTSVERREVDRLRAQLHEAIHRGPAVANRTGHPDLRAHLLGRLSWIESANPDRGAKLRRQFDQVTWD